MFDLCCLAFALSLTLALAQGKQRWPLTSVTHCIVPLHMHCTTKTMHPSSRRHLILSPLIVHTVRIPPQGLRRGQGSVNLVLFHTASHMTSPSPRTPNPSLCTRISGSVVEILDNSKHYQPQCQITFVSCSGFVVAVVGVRSCTQPANVLLHARVCVYCF